MTDKELFIKTWYLYLKTNYRNIAEDVCFYIACQFALESDYGRSRRALIDMNITGMKKPYSRLTTSLSREGDFACYYNVKMCVVDFMFCLLIHGVDSLDLSTVIRYGNAIKKWYCPEKDYLNKIQSIYQQFNYLRNEQK